MQVLAWRTALGLCYQADLRIRRFTPQRYAEPDSSPALPLPADRLA
jgi:hypothetical protein